MNIREFKTTLYQEMSGLTKALGNPHRLEILDLLAQGPASVEYIAKHTNMTTGNTSQHLQVLKNARLVESKRDWKYINYRLADQNVFDAWSALRKLSFSHNATLNQLLGDYRSRQKFSKIISPKDLIDKMNRHEVVILDVRPEEEFLNAHIKQALSIPKKNLEERLNELPDDKEIVVYCRGPLCLMADEAIEILNKHGFNAARLENGYPDWAAKNLPVEVG